VVVLHEVVRDPVLAVTLGMKAFQKEAALIAEAPRLDE
jgi:hypothetical protein